MHPNEIIERLAAMDPWHHCIGFPEMEDCQFCGASGPEQLRAHAKRVGRNDHVIPTHNANCIWYEAVAIDRAARC